MNGAKTQGLPPGWTLVAFQKLDSTNAEMKRRLAAESPGGEGLIVRADTQSAGRGRHGRTWESPVGNIYASFLIVVQEKTAACQIGLVGAVSVIDALSKRGVAPLRCKWPNDILLDGKKVCGILPEMVADTAGRDWVILGVGINLQPVAVKDAIYPVTSVAEHGVTVAPDQLVRELAINLAKRLAQWRTDGFAPIAKDWTDMGPPLGQKMSIRMSAIDGNTLEGEFGGLDRDGSLLIAAGGEVRRIMAGEVIFHEAH